MRATAGMLGSALLLALSVGSAAAGPCTSEIDKLAQVLMAQNANTSMPPGPTRTSQLPSTTIRETTGSAPASSEAEHGTTVTPEAQSSGGSGDSGGCGCSTPGTSTHGAMAALGGLAAVGLVVARRRKR